MNTAASPAYPVRYDGGRYDWSDHHHWHHHHGRVIWHAGPVLIGMMILGFLFFWPLGFIALALTIWSVKMGCGHYGEGHWGARWQERMMAKRARWEQRMAEHMERHHRQ